MGIKIDCISDLHGNYPKLEGGDLLIVAGDLIATHDEREFQFFAWWLNKQLYKKKIFIGGNHDTFIVEWDKEEFGEPISDPNDQVEYLCDSGTEFEGLKIWGTPLTKTFEGMNPHCKAFTVDTEEELEEKWILIPKDTDILITHSPAYDILDKEQYGYPCGSKSLRELLQYVQPKLHVFGHIHEGYGKALLKHAGPNTWCVNASHVNRRYRPVNNPIRIEL